MKKKAITIVYITLILIVFKIICNYVVNSILINRYNKNIYNENLAKALTFLNFPQKYIANYNYGNILYNNREYEQAIEQYKKALNGIVPKNKECSIRINYALAICKTVEVDESDSETIANAIKTYESAIDILTKNGCANQHDDNGHSKKAEQLKQDIQKEIEKLKKLENYEENNEKKDEDKEKNNKQETETIEKKMKDIKENALQVQRELEIKYKNFGNLDFDRVEKNW